MKACIALIGLSGSGKSTFGPRLAARLGWRFIDTDTLIEARAGQPIAEIFAERGEEAFRALESEVLAEACRPESVVATGGGCIEVARNRALLAAAAWVVWLAGSPATLAERIAGDTSRPLLAHDPLNRLAAQAERRSSHYAATADWIVKTDLVAPDMILQSIEQAWRMASPHDPAEVTTPGGNYRIVIARDALQELPAFLSQLGLRRKAWLISDDHVLPMYGKTVATALGQAGITFDSYAIPAGEAHKSMTTVAAVHDWLLGSGVERGDVVLALGGGVVGDLAGFAAATILRGIAVVQLPTTVLAMVDSSIGGKTGVDHAVGKNLIGAFHQPRLVLADTAVLASLPPAERTAGWAEAIKHGMIGDPGLFADLATQVTALRELREPFLSDILRRAAGFKAAVVSGDEREGGDRILLNYGHTIGHALEAWSNFELRHGEAVAIGMSAEAEIARRLEMCTADVRKAQNDVLELFGLPTRVPANVDPEAIVARLSSDKKVKAQRVQWVLPTAIGKMTVRRDVPTSLVADVLRASQSEARS